MTLARAVGLTAALLGACVAAPPAPLPPSAPTPRPTTSFKAHFAQEVEPYGQQLAVADFNRDGVHDLAIAAPGVVTVLTAVGAAWRTLATTEAPGEAYLGLRAIDLDRDARVDLLAASGGLRLLKQGADGGFSLDLTIETSPRDAGQAVTSLEVADLTGDGRADVVVGNSALQGSAVWFLEGVEGWPWLASPRLVATLPTHTTAMAIAPLDGDDRPDLAASHVLSGAVTFIPFLPSGAFGAPVELAVPSGLVPDSIAAGDLDGDGRNDLVVANRSNAPVVLRGTAGGFAPAQSLPVAGCGVVRVADLDLDGLSELILGCVVRVTTIDRPALSALVVVRSSGPTTFEIVHRLETVDLLTDVQVSDLTGDGRLDLAATFLLPTGSAPRGQVRLWSGAGPE